MYTFSQFHCKVSAKQLYDACSASHLHSKECIVDTFEKSPLPTLGQSIVHVEKWGGAW